MCTIGNKVHNGQHQNVYEYHPFFSKKLWIKPMVDKENKKQVIILYHLQQGPLSYLRPFCI
jgi:hypothetical protein